ncbi:type II toxin-antitoxin system ParD family antitoxin [Rhizobium sp. LCM 4573]|uniref:type II toxin-antitoxin system ParD family antitoxin n=1 Tax=Rhizobium sp. LCM 4573 TaxID=1848291 RepID=UPI0008D93064|nr:type II toxin-antitoxin system ParD family antitoxin [Rhizobium sp. LCM 4573]OHV76012.1 CopG family transcriptional regulator [Rhizobium sp. LCM 4573]
MNVSVGQRWEKFIEQAVQDGRYGSASEVVREGLRLVEERETKLAALRETIQQSIAAGGSFTDEEVDAALRVAAEDLRREGY